MNLVLTLIGDPGSSELNDAVVAAARGALAEAGARVGRADWLAPGIACDIPFEAVAAEQAEAAVRGRLDGAPVDLAAQMTTGRHKKLLVADMESTIIGQEMIDELAEVAGIAPQVTKITARAMAGELDFAAALHERVSLLAGLPATTLDKVAERITLNPGARGLVQTMRANGATTALVSGGFTCFTERVREACGFEEAHGNHLIVADGTLTGAVAEPLLGRDAKRETLLELAAREGLSPDDACAVGDGANDLAMIEIAGLGVAYRAKPVLRTAARYSIDHGDLTALLYLQGYRRAEILG